MKHAPDIHDVVQGSDKWKELHIGRPSASNFHKILTPGGTKSDQRKRYMYRLVAETLMGEYLPARPEARESESASYWVNRGIDMEPIAFGKFEEEHNLKLKRIGFITTPAVNGAKIGRVGCSPDGVVVGKNEAVEIKSPAPWTQIEYLLTKVELDDPDPKGPWSNYKPQVQGQMLVGRFDCVHFYAYHPRMPGKYFDVLPNKTYQDTLRQALADFLGDMDDATKKARELGTFKTAQEIMELVE